MNDTSDILDMVHALDKRLAMLEKQYLSLDAKCDNAASHSIGVDADLVKVREYLCERKKARDKWEQMKRQVVTHMICWGLPLIAAWAILVFSGGLKQWVRQWLGA